MMRTLAHEVTKHRANAVVIIGEYWMAPIDTLGPYERPESSPDRQEPLCGILVRRQGDPIGRRALILRDGETVSLGETEMEEGEGATFFFAPVYEAWGKDIPRKWFELTNVSEDD